jgi:hypothetical protein
MPLIPVIAKTTCEHRVITIALNNYYGAAGIVTAIAGLCNAGSLTD